LCFGLWLLIGELAYKLRSKSGYYEFARGLDVIGVFVGIGLGGVCTVLNILLMKCCRLGAKVGLCSLSVILFGALFIGAYLPLLLSVVVEVSVVALMILTGFADFHKVKRAPIKGSDQDKKFPDNSDEADSPK
jgi:hypothetical protein